MTKKMRAVALSTDLHRIADLIACNPDLIATFERAYLYSGIYFYSSEGLADFIKVLAPHVRQSMGSDMHGWAKSYSDNYATIRGWIGSIQWAVSTARDNVCERVVVGTETVTETIPDPDAPTITREVTRDIVEWKCGPILTD